MSMKKLSKITLGVAGLAACALPVISASCNNTTTKKNKLKSLYKELGELTGVDLTNTEFAKFIDSLSKKTNKEIDELLDIQISLIQNAINKIKGLKQ
ncbi:hypothetical protein KQ874_02530 [Mycoplasma sp. ES3157-GEN-MYC]|uniref:Uncharacterized protein n=1 Tax=Mycoplasma miroungigenitalium TaxID=754515 RepID=A0A6M4JC73_9MOLU|nr:hypothetical protein [Mycoplasma miroungigenitalium]MBU4690560.1 hypothetical protein [Mycoplasma miroungigenitalium]MBU4691827.1 hypothetical protein [Mycoplasma miroungigenitalium]QJR43687.1 hypothetical protein HLA87_02730 [Mycoplasma miroungigenitalium]